MPEFCNWSVEPYIINSKTRYRVINKFTKEVLDDAQGYGFKTELKARKCYIYKLYHPM